MFLFKTYCCCHIRFKLNFFDFLNDNSRIMKQILCPKCFVCIAKLKYVYCGITTQGPYILKKHTELYKILKFRVNWANSPTPHSPRGFAARLSATPPKLYFVWAYNTASYAGYRPILNRIQPFKNLNVRIAGHLSRNVQKSIPFLANFGVFECL